MCSLHLPLNAQDTVVTLKGVSVKQLDRKKTPLLIDGTLLQERARQLTAGLNALTHMSEMISEAHARRAMKAQIESLKATISALEDEITRAARVDYKLPTPMPTGQKEQQRSQASSTSNQTSSDTQTSRNLSKDQSAVKAMSSAQLSRYWGAIEAAAFRDDKMAVVRKVKDEVYLTAEQAEVLIESLTFSKDRRDALVLIYPKLVDPDGVNVLYRLLDHPSHRREVERKVKRINTARRQRQAQQAEGGF
jgi:hypothetical protein